MTITKLTKEEIERKRNWDLDRFLDVLKAAVTLAGGCGDNRWNDMNIEIAYKELHKNGIKLKIKLDDRFLCRHYPVGED
jgi:hypothetical protein